MVKIFEIQNGTLIPTEHCYSLTSLKKIMGKYEDYIQVYLYLFYMTCPDPELNPFFDTPEIDKEDIILSQLGDIQFTTEDSEIIEAMELLTTLYSTPTLRAYIGIKGALDNLANYMGTAEITAGRDGNITALINAAAKFEQVRTSFKGAYKDLIAEQSISVRGNSALAYDQE